MATKARQQYHADEVTLSKERREFSISDDVQEKIDGIEEGAQVNTIETIRVNGNEISPDENKAIDLTIPGVIDSLSSTSITDALSARQGKILYDKIDNVSRIGHFLALWDASTGLPVTDPEVSPYEYHAGDFYTISVVASQGGTNYKPSGTEYISGQASTAVETDDVEVNDFYFYDGTYRRHMKNSGAGGMAVDGSLSTTSRNPVENRVITNALSGKQNTLTAGANIQINGNTISATDTKYTAGTGISIANGVISNTQTSAERGNITGTLSDQTDLQTVLTSKATDANVVHKTGAETIAGTKTFSTSPVVPSKTTAATNTGTAIATEAQVYKKQDTLVSGTNIKTINSNSLLGSGNLTLNDVKVSATAPSNPTEGMVWYDTTNDSLKAYNGTSWETEGTKMVVLEYGVSTWQDFLDAYNKNAVVYCKVSSGSSGYRMAFMAYTAGRSTPTEVEFQYYRSRSSHSTAANQLDEVYVYKLTNAGVWTTTQRDTAAKAIAGTGIGLTYNSSGMTISADTTTLATKTDLNSKQDTLVSGTNIKTVNSNSLLGSGNLTLNDVKVSATAPSSPTEGMVWYDTTNDVLKVYDGTNWNVTGKEYNAGPGIEIGTYNDYSAMQGPAPDGFHVPSKDEWTTLCGILTDTFGMASNDITVGTYLKMPMAGNRNYSSSSVSSNGGYYWASTVYTNSANNLLFYSGHLRISSYGRSYAFSVRCFKDVPVIPDSSWTTLYQGTGSTGVFRNSSLGLISVSGDGTTWYTIQDKNLGATTVYNQGDTLSDANCGYFYQWGNNYGFPHSGTVTKSATQVDASNYGPGNYYNSSTFITGSGDWSSVQNDNLWGGATGVVTLENAISNTGVLSVNGQTGDVVIASPEESNTKTFYLSNTSDLTNAQAAYDWYKAGKNPIIVYGTARYNIVSSSSTLLLFVYNNTSILSQAKVTSLRSGAVKFTISNGSVTGITVDSYTDNILKTDYDYQVPYIPQYNGSPATKKYVDDSIKTYTAGTNIQISSSNVISATDTKYNAGTGIGISNNTISNTGVTSVNGETGGVIINEITFSEEAPANPSTGAGWFDYNDDFRIYSQDNSWKLINNVYKTRTPGVGDNIGYYSDLRNKIIVFSFNEDMSDRWIVTDSEYGDWNEQSQMAMSYKIIAIGQVADDADTTFISQRGLTRPKGMATLEITATNDGNGNFICSNIQFKEIGSGGFKLAPNSPLTPKYRRYGSQAQYDALTQYYTDEPGDTVYFTI